MTGITPQGNFEPGWNVLQFQKQPHSGDQLIDEWSTIRQKLKAARQQRIPPGKDEKIITEWNAMAIRAYAEAGLLLNRADYLLIAKKSLRFILENMLSPDNTLFRTWRDGQIGQPGTLADYATLIAALHAVYVIDFDPQVYQQMRSLFATLQENFSSKDDLYYDTSDQIANLVVRPRNLQDNATPSGNAMAAFSHWLFANYEHEPENFDRASRMVARVNNYLRDYPTSFGYWLQVPERLRQDSKQVALISPANLNSLKPFLTVYRERYRPYAIIAARIAEHSEEKALPGILNDQSVIDGKPTAYVCQGFICRAPVTDVELFKAQLSQ